MEQNPLGTQPVGRLLRRFAAPAIVSMLVGSLYNLVDQLFIGHAVGLQGNAATNVAFPLNTVCIALALLFGLGGASRFNLYLGAGKEERARRTAGSAIGALMLSGVLTGLLSAAFLRPLLTFFGARGRVLELSLTYTGITCLGFPLLVVSSGMSHLIRADGAPRWGMVCMMSGAAVNTALDALFVLGFDWGMAGAAWATVIGQAVSAGLALYYLRRYRSVTLTRRDLIPRLRALGGILSLGAAGCVNQLAMMVVQITLNNSLSYYGALSDYGRDIPLACAGIITKVSMISFSLVLGVCQGSQPIIGFNYGAQNYRRVRRVFFLAAGVVTAIGTGATLIFQLFPHAIIRLFGQGSDAYFAFAARYFRIYLMLTFLNGLQPLASSFFTSIGKATRSILLSLTRQVLFLLPLIVLLPRFFGVDGILFSAPIADAAAAALALFLLYREIRRMPGEATGGKFARPD